MTMEIIKKLSKEISPKEYNMLRANLGMKRAALAEVLGVNIQVISNWGTGSTKIPQIHCIKLSVLAKELGIPNERWRDV